MRVLVTGSAGFIGSAVAQRLLTRGDDVVGIDNLNDYYDPKLKRARLARVRQTKDFESHTVDIEDRAALESIYERTQPQRVVHLAAQAGVRYSLTNPQAYVDANVTGFLNVIEAARHHGSEHVVFASTSSVYGASMRMPFSVRDHADHPVSLYAATKRANELMAHTYSHLFNIPMTGLRFFTVYGPWGRPDMALFEFTRRILADEPIDVFNHGHHKRDFTYIDDIVEGIVRVLDRPPAGDPNWDARNPDPATSAAPYRLHNIGSNRPIELLTYIDTLERCLGKKAQRRLLPLQPGDVPDTFADVDTLVDSVGYQPTTTIQEGVAKFVDWYVDYHGHNSKR